MDSVRGRQLRPAQCCYRTRRSGLESLVRGCTCDIGHGSKAFRSDSAAPTAPRGLAIRISAVHMCKTHRGIRASHKARMVTTTYFGSMADDRDLKNEFLQECVGLQR